jgi:hypothetical protein
VTRQQRRKIATTAAILIWEVADVEAVSLRYRSRNAKKDIFVIREFKNKPVMSACTPPDARRCTAQTKIYIARVHSATTRLLLATEVFNRNSKLFLSNYLRITERE